MESKEYKIQGVTLTLGEFKVGQFKDLTKLLQDVELTKTTQLYDLITSIVDLKLKAFMELVFYNQDLSKIIWNDVSFEQMDEIIESFLALNPRLKMRLSSLFGILVSSGIAATQLAEEKPEKSTGLKS